MSEAGVRSIPLAPLASRQTASFVEHSPSTEIELKLRSTAGRRKLDRLARLERVVGREHREHRRQLRMDHPGALRHPADGEPVERDRGLLRLRVGGQDRLGRVWAARGRDRRRGVAQAAEHLLERQQRADHAGREDEHLLGVEVEQPSGLRRGRERIELAALAGGGVRDARVDHDRLRLGRREMLLRDDDRRREHLVDGEHRRPDGGHGRADDGEVEPLAADARVHAGGGEPLRGGDAHTSTPESRRPAVSGRPSARFAFCTAWPAAPLPRLSSAQTTMPGAGRAVGEDADLGSVRALDARELGREPLRQHRHGGRGGVRSVERVPQVRGRGHVTGGEQPPLHRQQVRDEADGEAERLRDLGRVLVRADLVRRDVLEHRGRVRRRLQRPPRAGDARLRVDDDCRPARSQSTSGASASRTAVA